MPVAPLQLSESNEVTLALKLMMFVRRHNWLPKSPSVDAANGSVQAATVKLTAVSWGAPTVVNNAPAEAAAKYRSDSRYISPIGLPQLRHCPSVNPIC